MALDPERVWMIVVVAVAVVMGMRRVTVSALQPLLEKPGANQRHERAARQGQPRIDSFQCHLPGGVQRPQTQQEDAGRVRQSYHASQEDGIQQPAAATDKVCRDDCLAMPRRQCMGGAEESGHPKRRCQECRTQGPLMSRARQQGLKAGALLN